MKLQSLVVTSAAVGLLSLVTVRQASADIILVFGQSSDSNTVTGTVITSGVNNGHTVISGTDIAISITQIDPSAGISIPPSISAFLDFSIMSTGDATVTGVSPGQLDQTYSGTFSINSLATNTGINYLSGSFSDDVAGAVTGHALTLNAGQPPKTLSFTSDVITTLGLDRALALSFSNVLTNVSTTLQNGHTTLTGFTSSISGNFSANIGATPTVPEPASMLLLGSGLVGLAGATRRRLRKTL